MLSVPGWRLEADNNNSTAPVLSLSSVWRRDDGQPRRGPHLLRRHDRAAAPRGARAQALHRLHLHRHGPREDGACQPYISCPQGILQVRT